MTAMARHFDDLGPDFDTRWKQTPRALKRELIAELRDLYIFLEDEEMPLLAGKSPAGAPAPVAKTAPVPAPAAQGLLFTDAGTPSRKTARGKDNPFLPQSVLDRLQESQTRASAGLRRLMQDKPASAASHEQVDLERELRLKLGPIVESLIDAHMDTLRSELRVRLRAEMDRLIAEHVRKG